MEARKLSITVLVMAVVPLAAVLAQTETIPPVQPIYDIKDGFYKEMAEFAVRENNKAHPHSEQLKLVSVDKGFRFPFNVGEVHYRLYITCSDRQGRQAKYTTFTAYRIDQIPTYAQYFNLFSFKKI
ncbi:unnamed protein product [Linum trigynum]|uniref:Cystatin domain-containing protein n=1 Tax=Linum trigynum TaxID=586398 RepID=A0AAV2CVN6_9ROSI